MKHKKIKDIIVFIVIFVVMTATILTRNLNDLDELWNYNFARNVSEGKLPYKDFNIIQMPLLPIICGVFLKIIANELIVMRLLASILNTVLFFMICKIMRLLKIDEKIINISLIIMYFLYCNYFCIDYNFFVLLIAMICLYFELKSINKNETILKNNLIHDLGLGILIGISILVKQTTGLFICGIFVFYKILIVSKKEELKEILKIVIERLVGVSIPIFILIIYLIKNNIWNDFLNYAIFGIKTFSNYIPYSDLLKDNSIHISALSILIPIVIIYMYIKTVVKEQKTQEDRNIFLLFCYSVGCFIVVFPIADTIHFLVGSIPAIISLIYILYLTGKKLIKKEKNIIFIKNYAKAFSSLMTFFIIFIAVCLSVNYFLNLDEASKFKHYRYIPSTLDKRIENLNFYVKNKNLQGKKVYILDKTACLFMISMDKYNKDYDMFMKGNLGAKGEEGQIEKLEKENDIIVLILNQKYPRNWQNPEKVREYIINNWSKKGEIDKFDIYEKE